MFAILVGVAASVVAALALGVEEMTTFEVFAIVVPVQSVSTLGYVAWLVRRRGLSMASLSLRARWSDLVGVPVGFGIQIALGAIAVSILETFFDGDLPGQGIVEIARDTVDPATRVLIVVGVVVLGPIAEEVVFRGMLLPALLPRGRRFAVWGSSALFSLLHLLDPNALFSVPFLFVVGLVLANEQLRTGRLARPIAIHAGFNLITVLVLFLA